MKTLILRINSRTTLLSIVVSIFFLLHLLPCSAQTPTVATPMSFMQEALTTINSLRTNHQSGPLTLNISLSADAEAWAKKIGAQCDKVGKATAYYSRAAGVGENVWASGNFSDVNGTIPVMAWYSQFQPNAYNWSNNIFNQSTAQFTTLVWKASTQFGIAKYKTPKNGYIMVVARFLPQGNIAYYSTFAANVLPPLNSTAANVASNSSTAASGSVDDEGMMFIPETINQSANG